MDMLDRLTEWQLIVLLMGALTAPLWARVTSHLIRKQKLHYKKAQAYADWVIILGIVIVMVTITVTLS